MPHLIVYRGLPNGGGLTEFQNFGECMGSKCAHRYPYEAEDSSGEDESRSYLHRARLCQSCFSASMEGLWSLFVSNIFKVGKL